MQFYLSLSFIGVQNVENLKSVQFCTDFIFCTFPACDTANLGSAVTQWYSACLETEGLRVRASPAALPCVLQQATLILA